MGTLRLATFSGTLVATLACGGRDSGAQTTGSSTTTTDPFPDDEGGGEGAEASSAADDGGADDGGADSGSDKLDTHEGEGEGGDPGGDCPCQNVMDGIYVLNSNAPPSVWFYDPLTNQFSLVGNLGCPASGNTVANSMAIDRQGNAYLNYYTTTGIGGTDTSNWTGALFKVPLTNLAACEDLGYMARGSWFLLGMGYSVVSEGSSCDKMYLYNSDKYPQYPNFTGNASQLARWNDTSRTVEVIGNTVYPVGELTGTGDGRLYAFATVALNQSALIQFDKATGQELENVPLNGLDITNAFAFAFWGGDVYFFTQTSPGVTNSKVTRLDYDANAGGGLSVVNANTGLHITGAGVSTCASVMPPIG